MYCRYCGKEVGDAAWCPYCGAKQQPDNAQQQQTENNTSSNYESQNAWGEQINLSTPAPRTNGFAVAGLILAFFSPLLGLIFSCIGLSKAREYGSGKGLAIAGIVVSILSIIFSIIATLTILPQLEAALIKAGYTLS